MKECIQREGTVLPLHPMPRRGRAGVRKSPSCSHHWNNWSRDGSLMDAQRNGWKLMRDIIVTLPQSTSPILFVTNRKPVHFNRESGRHCPDKAVQADIHR